MTSRLIIFSELESTQDKAKELALAGEPERTAVLALKQTHGRGRFGHTWISPPNKNLALSWILRPRLVPADAALLGLMASIAVAEALEDMGVVPVTFKWPNDVLVAGRKIAGILPEANLNQQTVNFVIIGIGLNVNCELDDFPNDLKEMVTSVFLRTETFWKIEDVARLILSKLDTFYDRIKRESCRFVVDLWKARWGHKGSKILINGEQGVAEDIDSDGTLLVRMMDNRLVRITSGEIELL